ncbi:MAG: hypothetical protein U9O59_01880 [Actinomycetota bacterium]|nr:hypothetical protein [Actinomycetota bacterium]
MINLDKIQKKVDKLFAGETKKSLTQWLKNHRKGNNPYDINLSFSTDSDYGIRKGDKITIPGGNTYMVTRDYGNNKFRAERIKKKL